MSPYDLVRLGVIAGFTVGVKVRPNRKQFAVSRKLPNNLPNKSPNKCTCAHRRIYRTLRTVPNTERDYIGRSEYMRPVVRRPICPISPIHPITLIPGKFRMPQPEKKCKPLTFCDISVQGALRFEKITRAKASRNEPKCRITANYRTFLKT
jgi:hypothetical protein